MHKDAKNLAMTSRFGKVNVSAVMDMKENFMYLNPQMQINGFVSINGGCVHQVNNRGFVHI